MATAIQRRRGNTAQHASFTGLAGEITIDTDKNTVVVHDGVTAGGYPLARADEVEALGGADITAVIAGSGLTGGASSGNATISLNYENLAGNLVPSANNTYSLGSIDKVWKDVYVGPGSLYVNGQKVLEDNNGTIVVSADSGQNLSIVTSGGGDLELSSGTTGDIQLKSNVTLAAGKTITASGGLKLSSNLDVNSQYINNVTNPVQAQDAATKGYVDGATYLSAGDGISKSTGQFSVDNTVVRTTGTQTIGGAKTFSADLVVSGNLTVSGTTTTVNSETISLADNIIDLNSNFTTGLPSENAGLRIKRGDSADVQIRWNEADDKWQFTNDGSAYQNMLTDAAARALISVTDAGGDGSLGYNSSTGVLTYTGPSAAEVRAHFSAGTGITITSGTIATTITQYTDADARGAISVSGDLSYDSATGVISFTNDAGDIESVTAGSGLTGGGTSGAVTLNIGAGTGILVNADDVAVNATYIKNLFSASDAGGDGSFSYSDGVFTYTGPSQAEANARIDARLSGGTGITYTSGVIATTITQYTDADARGAVSASGDLSYDSGTGVFSFTERTDAEVRGLISVSGDLSYDSATGVISYTEPTMYADSDARAAISVTDNGGDGSLSYNSGTGVITYTGPSASEVRAHFSAGTGITITSGAIAVDSTIATKDYANTAASAAVAAVIDAAPATLDTLNELAAALGDDANFSTTITNSIATKLATADFDSTANTWIGTQSTTALAEGTNLYFTAARARGNISVTDAGGDGSLSYNSSTGVITYTGPSASEVRAHLSAGTGLTYSSGAFSITNSGVTAGVYGNGTQVPVLNVNAQGQVTSASNLTITPAITSVTGLASGMADFLAAGNAATFAGAVSGTTGTGNIVLANSPILVTPDLGTPSAVILTNATNLKIEGIAAANLLTSGETFVDTDNQLMTAAAIDDRILSYGYTTNVGDITGVTAGNGLTGGGSSGDVTVNVVGGYGISVSADSVAVANADIRGLFSGSTGVSYDNSTGAFTLATGTAGSGLTYSSGVLAVGAGTGITVNADDIALSTSGVTAGTYGSASAVGQVVVDTYGRVTSASNVAISVSSSAVTDFTSAARTSISVTDAGGDGSLGYNSSTGVITYTGPSQAEANVRIDARLSAGTGISYSSGVIALSHLGIQSLTDPNADRILFWDDSAGAAAWLEVSTGLSLSGTALTNSGVTSITGTSNQVTASASTGGVTLSLPQNIHTGASPTFAGATLGSITKSGTDGVGDIGQSNNKFSTIYATTFSGSATTAKYADLAERYEADDILEPGTVVCFGGAKEITACDHPNDHAVAGVISTDPAYMMNSEAGPDSTHPYVALTGRVPVKVTGEVNKGDLLVASDVKGHAMANNNAKAGTIIGKALGASAGGEAVIEALVHLM